VPPSATSFETLEAEIAVIGAGPAGLSAAIRAANAGADVVVLDERDELGGQYFKPRSHGYRGLHKPDRQHQSGSDLRARAEASGARIISGQSIWFARPDGDGLELRSFGATGGFRLCARAVILASGAYERPAMVPGWTVPGV
jgi:flavin-dependent dehydrogenase